MKVKGLAIETIPSYETNGGQYRGIVQLEGEAGRQELRLSSRVLAEIFLLIRAEVAATARRNAEATEDAISEAAASSRLLEAAGYPAIESKALGGAE